MARLRAFAWPAALAVASVLGIGAVEAHILAMMNYESKTPEARKAMGLDADAPRREGIAVVDVDPASAGFGKIVADMSLPSDMVAHHIFYDRSQRKAYMTALAKSVLYVFDPAEGPGAMREVALPDCKLAEDVIFSADNKSWFLTCMMSARYIEGDVATDSVRRVVELPDSYPHGLAVVDAVDRVIVTSTVSGDLKDVRDEVIILEASSGKELERVRLSTEPEKAGEAPVELLLVPGSNPPVVYSTNMFGGTIWALAWNPASARFEVSQVVDFAAMEAGVPLEMYFNAPGDRMYVTTAKPGQLHIFDMAAGPMQPKLLASIATGAGAHHVGLTKDGRYAFVQNALLNLPGMDDGSVTVVDLQAGKAVASMDTLKMQGLNPNSIVLLPRWNDLGGH